MPKAEMIELEGTIVEVLPNATFYVEVPSGDGKRQVLCRLSGKLRMNFIRCTVGDKVTIEVSPYDLNKGRITWRTK